MKNKTTQDCIVCNQEGKIYVVVFTQRPEHINTFIRKDCGSLRKMASRY